MPSVRRTVRLAGRLALITVCVVLATQPSARGQLRPNPATVAIAPPELLNRLRASPFTYFRFINRQWITRVCELFADVPSPPIVRLHGDAHVEQFALTKDAWGLDDFDDSARGPLYVDIVRFLGSIDLATRQRKWTREREALWNRFLEGYRRGLLDPNYRPPEPDIVRSLRGQSHKTRAAFLVWGDRQMQPMEDVTLRVVVLAVEALGRVVRRERPSLAPGYFIVKRAGWLQVGVGSATTRKVLIRVEGPTAAQDDDELLEAKEVSNLDGISCLDGPSNPQALRIIDGTRQLGRLKHEILAIGPTMLIPARTGREEHWLEWWVTNWEPSYREVRLKDLRSVRDLAEIAFEAGIQLGAGEPQDMSVRQRTLTSVITLDARIRKETSTIVEEMLAGWREMGGR